MTLRFPLLCPDTGSLVVRTMASRILLKELLATTGLRVAPIIHYRVARLLDPQECPAAPGLFCTFERVPRRRLPELPNLWVQGPHMQYREPDTLMEEALLVPFYQASQGVGGIVYLSEEDKERV